MDSEPPLIIPDMNNLEMIRAMYDEALKSYSTRFGYHPEDPFITTTRQLVDKFIKNDPSGKQLGFAGIFAVSAVYAKVGLSVTQELPLFHVSYQEETEWIPWVFSLPRRGTDPQSLDEFREAVSLYLDLHREIPGMPGFPKRITIEESYANLFTERRNRVFVGKAKAPI